MCLLRGLSILCIRMKETVFRDTFFLLALQLVQSHTGLVTDKFRCYVNQWLFDVWEATKYWFQLSKLGVTRFQEEQRKIILVMQAWSMHCQSLLCSSESAVLIFPHLRKLNMLLHSVRIGQASCSKCYVWQHIVYMLSLNGHGSMFVTFSHEGSYFDLLRKIHQWSHCC